MQIIKKNKEFFTNKNENLLEFKKKRMMNSTVSKHQFYCLSKSHHRLK